jgi:hypothetical protein
MTGLPSGTEPGGALMAVRTYSNSVSAVPPRDLDQSDQAEVPEGRRRKRIRYEVGIRAAVSSATPRRPRARLVAPVNQ